MKINRYTRTWRMRLWLGGQVQRIAWLLCDPHDRWMVDYRIEGRPHGEVVHGFYSQARAKARELHGRIVGSSCETVDSFDGPDTSSDADWWKRS